MGLHYFCFIWIATLLVSASSITVNPQVQGCSLVGLDMQSCLVPNTKTPSSLDSCCKTLNQALQAGYYCLCSLLSPSNYPVFSTVLAVSFSSCYMSVPSLAHCQVSEPHPVMSAPPVAALPQLNLPMLPPLPPSGQLLPVLMPPDMPRDKLFVPLPPKVNEIPQNNSSIVERNPTTSGSRSLPKLSIPKRRDYLSSDGVNVKTLLHSRNLLMLTVFACIARGHDYCVSFL